MSNKRTPPQDDEPWQCLNEAVRELELGWAAGSAPDLATLLPAAPDAIRAWILIELIKIDQEHCYQARRPKPLETYLDEWPELRGDARRTAELLEAECLTRMVLGDVPQADELSARFPEAARRIDLAGLALNVEREDAAPATSGMAPGSNDADTAAEAEQERYRIRAVLGRGAMGTVYRAHDTQLDREVALKVPSAGLGQDPAIWKRLFCEARAVARIRHRNVCPVFDIGQRNGAPFIAMELIEGKSLAARFQQGPLDCRQAAELVRKLAGALAVVHAAGIIHGDVKPQNIMLDAEGEPLLTDFGLARFMQTPSAGGGEISPLGTPAYMSPEQMRGEPAGTASDIYSLGVVLYQALAGRLPFRGSAAQLVSQVLHDRLEPPGALRPGISPRLESICMKAMARRTCDRYRSAKELEDALATYLDSPSPASRSSRVRNEAREAVSVIYLQPLTFAARVRLMAGSIVLGAVAIAGVLWVVWMLFLAGR